MVIISYVAKTLIILLGAAVLIGLPPVDGMPSPMREVFATVVMLFGAYRLVAFIVTQRRPAEEPMDE